MNYPASVTDFFKPARWMMNLLLAGVCVLIPVIGGLVIKGWLVTGFWGREEERPETFPDFDFNQFGKYLERGVWPFLVTLVASLPISMLAGLGFAIIMFVGVAGAASDSSGGGVLAVIVVLFSLVAYLVVVIGMMLVLTPLTIRAALTQDFGSAFNFAFVKRFIALTWKESLLAALFLTVASMALIGVGALVVCVGMYFAMVVIAFCGEHLHKQLYQLYLTRGGEPVPVSAKLRLLAPPPPL